jgi:primosomal replication protein N''
MTELVRYCPNCDTERPAHELFCSGMMDGRRCGYALADLDVVPRGASQPRPTAGPEVPPGPEPIRPASDGPRCPNGHPVEPGDQLCLICGAAVTGEVVRPGIAPANEASETPTPTVIDGWQLVGRVPTASEMWERFLAERTAGGRKGLLTLYAPGAEPDPAVHEVLRRMPHDHIPELLATGRWRERAYEVFERIEGGTLADAGWMLADDPALFRRMVDELGRALDEFAEVGLRHRGLRPRTILIRSLDPLDLVITGFGSARLSDLDLEAVAPLSLTRYSAPEAIVGGVSAASDWWSLGMILLEQATRGACFEGINDQAFRIHVVTRGVAVPEVVEPETRLLLRGLLARDPLRRWHWKEVGRWLAGEALELPPDERRAAEADAGRRSRSAGDRSPGPRCSRWRRPRRSTGARPATCCFAGPSPRGSRHARPTRRR